MCDCPINFYIMVCDHFSKDSDTFKAVKPNVCEKCVRTAELARARVRKFRSKYIKD